VSLVSKAKVLTAWRRRQVGGTTERERAAAHGAKHRDGVGFHRGKRRFNGEADEKTWPLHSTGHAAYRRGLWVSIAIRSVGTYWRNAPLGEAQ
jgi:hypothetical protein